MRDPRRLDGVGKRIAKGLEDEFQSLIEIARVFAVMAMLQKPKTKPR
jgi:hypothetical protein